MAHYPKARRGLEWARGSAVELIADPRDYLTRRIAELELGMVIGRSRPMMYGTRTDAVKAKIIDECDVRLPWELDDYE